MFDFIFIFEEFGIERFLLLVFEEFGVVCLEWMWILFFLYFKELKSKT